MELIIKEACTVSGESVATHAAVGQEVDVSKDEAATLTRMGRALYLNKAEDPTKGTLTASKDDVAALKKQAKSIEAAESNRVAAPNSQAAIIADAVTAAVTAALAAKAAEPKAA